MCDQPLDYERQRSDAMDAALFGTIRYAHCNGCGRRVQEPWNDGYRGRWDAVALSLGHRTDE